MASDDPREKIRQRAYDIWEHEGRPGGRELEHWLQAEHECRSTASQAVVPAAARVPVAQELALKRKPKPKRANR